MPKKFNIVTAEAYEKNGEQKKVWHTVGELILWPAKGDKGEQYSVKLYMSPSEKFYVFEQKERGSTKPSNSDSEDTIE